jgi:hypothetical protein
MGTLREPLYGKFALLVLGTTLFSVEFFGLGNQYLWKNSAWMSIHAGGLFALTASCGAYLFVEQALARPGKDLIFSRLMQGGAALCVVSALAYAADIMSVETLVVIVSTLGVMPMLLGLPGAYFRARGDAVGVYFLLGWGVSFASSAVLSQVISGKVDAVSGPCTRCSSGICSTCWSSPASSACAPRPCRPPCCAPRKPPAPSPNSWPT